MRTLARVRAKAARLHATGRGGDDEALALVDDCLDVIETLRAECAALRQRCADLTQRAAVRDAEVRRLFDALPQAIVTTDGAGGILDANRSACQLLARSRAKLTGDLLLHFADDREHLRPIIRELAKTDTAVTTQARLRPNERAPFEARITVLRDPRGDAPQWLWLLAREQP